MWGLSLDITVSTNFDGDFTSSRNRMVLHHLITTFTIARCIFLFAYFFFLLFVCEFKWTSHDVWLGLVRLIQGLFCLPICIVLLPLSCLPRLQAALCQELKRDDFKLFVLLSFRRSSFIFCSSNLTLFALFILLILLSMFVLFFFSINL